MTIGSYRIKTSHLVTLFILLVLASVFPLIAPYYSTQIIWTLRSWMPFWVFLALSIAFCTVAFITYVKMDERTREVNTSLIAVPSLIALTGLGVGIAAWIGISYERSHTYSASTQTVTEDAPLSYQQRVPFDVAQEQSKSNIQNLTGVTLLDDTTRYSPSTEQFSTLVKGRQVLGNYAAVIEQTSSLVGRNSGSQCEFDPSQNKSLGGWFTHNLGRSINSQKKWVRWHEDDAYGYCSDGDPIVVVPLTSQKGWINVTERPAGVALYNGKTGEVTITDDTKSIPGVTYPMSLAAKQREGMNASGSFIDWIMNRVGYDVAEGSKNTSNNSEFVLGSADGTTHYATMLSPRGNSENVVAISDIVADNSVRGELAPMIVHPVKWASLSAINSRIRADYQDIPNWQSIEVKEIIPVSATQWVATIGNSQNILYRVTGNGDLTTVMPGRKEAVTCLTRGKDTTPIRCGTEALQDGNGIGTQYGKSGAPEDPKAPSAPVPSDLSGMSVKDLLDLSSRINSELSKKVGGN